MWEALVDREQGFRLFSREVLEAVRDTRVLIVGCGGNGAVADLLVRAGFEHFGLIDDDVVEDTNLNRLPFTRKAVGLSKVEAWRRHLLSINPDCDVSVWQRRVTRHDGGWFASVLHGAGWKEAADFPAGLPGDGENATFSDADADVAEAFARSAASPEGRSAAPGALLVFLGTTDPEANLVAGRICAAEHIRMIIGPASSGGWIVGTFVHDDGVTLEGLARFGTEEIPLENIDYQALRPLYVRALAYPGRADRLRPGVGQAMIGGRLPARSCGIFVRMTNAAMAFEAVKNVAELHGLPVEGTAVVRLPVVQIFDPYSGCSYLFNAATGAIGIPDWLTGEVRWAQPDESSEPCSDHSPGHSPGLCSGIRSHS